jgi:ATP-dependent Clp protease ATP-binding subunit ClpA
LGLFGVGKTAIAEGLALRISHCEAPAGLENKHLISLNLTGLVAGTRHRSEFEFRINKLIIEVQKAKNIIYKINFATL